jgi:hypothetical protein
MADTGRGFMVLADISGYTAFVTATELEHGPPIIAALLEEVIARISPPLDVLEVEGDAVFALGRDGTVVPPAILVDILRSGFAAFRARQRELEADESCNCRACSGVGGLRLKIIGHHGPFLKQTIGGRAQVAGPDVILLHRLAKNGVARDDNYALFTRPALNSMGIDPDDTALRAHTERYEYFGEVPCFVMLVPALSSPRATGGVLDAQSGLV